MPTEPTDPTPDPNRPPDRSPDVVYDAAGRIIRWRDPPGVVTYTRYDSGGGDTDEPRSDPDEGPPGAPDARPAPSEHVTISRYDSSRPPTAGPATTYVYDSGRPPTGGSVTTTGYDLDGGPRPLSTWYTTYDRNGQVVYSGPTPMPEPPPDADQPPDEPHVIG